MLLVTISENVKDGILQISFDENQRERETKDYRILNKEGKTLMSGKIPAYALRTCLYIGDLKRGLYLFEIEEMNAIEFTVQ